MPGVCPGGGCLSFDLTGTLVRWKGTSGKYWFLRVLTPEVILIRIFNFNFIYILDLLFCNGMFLVLEMVILFKSVSLQAPINNLLKRDCLWEPTG